MSSNHAFAKILYREHAHYHSGLVTNQQVANISGEELREMQIIEVKRQFHNKAPYVSGFQPLQFGQNVN